MCHRKLSHKVAVLQPGRNPRKRLANKFILSNTTSLKPAGSIKMNSRTPKKDAEQVLCIAPLGGYFTNLINTKSTRSFIRKQTLPGITPKDNKKN